MNLEQEKVLLRRAKEMGIKVFLRPGRAKYRFLVGSVDKFTLHELQIYLDGYHDALHPWG